MIKKLFRKLFKKPDTISFRQGFDLTELPIVTLYQNEKKFNFLLDTGANNSVINKSVLDQIEHERVDMSCEVSGLEGNTSEAAICLITLSYKDQRYTHPYMICDTDKAFSKLKKEYGVTVHGIIGSVFFNKFKYVLDFDELVAYSKK